MGREVSISTAYLEGIMECVVLVVAITGLGSVEAGYGERHDGCGLFMG